MTLRTGKGGRYRCYTCLTKARQGGRFGVFYSREDLSTGLVGQSVDGIYGYEPATATRLMRAMLLYAMNDGKLPAAAPPTATAGK